MMNAVVIGATQGLGLCLTKELLAGGHRVAAGVIDRSTPASLKELETQYPGKLLVFQADVTDEEEIAAGALKAKAFFGQADTLCCVAGVILKGDRDTVITDINLSDLRRTFAVNTFGPVIVGKHFLPVMKKGANLFIVTSEGVGVKNCGTWIPCYGLSKTTATKVAGMFNAATGDADFYAVHPGRMNTEMGKTTAQIEPEESAQGFYALMTGKTPISRENWYIDYKGIPMEA